LSWKKYSRLIGASAVIVGGAGVSAITGDPQYSQAGAGLAAAGNAADFFKGIGESVLASDLYQAFTQESPAARDLLENHDLRRLVGTTIAACVKTAEANADKSDKKSIQKLIEIVPDGWQALANHPMIIDTTDPILEANLVSLITITAESAEPVEPVLTAAEWTTVLKPIAELKAPGFSFTDAAFERAAQKLQDHFLPMLFEAAKSDFANKGEAYAALQLRILSEILNTQKKALTNESLDEQLKEQTRKQMVSFSRVSKSYSIAIANRIKATGKEIKEQSRTQYAELIRSLDENHDEIIRLGEQVSRIEEGVSGNREIMEKVSEGVEQLVASSKLGQKETAESPKHLPPRVLPKAAAKKFYGRRAERNQLFKLLQQRLDTTVVGQAGYGKTALAAWAVAEVIGKSIEELPSSPFPDGVVFLDLYKSQCDFNLLHGQLADAFASPDSNKSPRERAIEACRGRKILVIVEGAEVADGEEERPHLSELLVVLAPENCRLILTRDIKQVAGTSLVQLKEKLGDTDALNLFKAFAGNRVEGDLRKQILELLNGHPLAITWAGGLLSLEDEDASLLADEWQKDPTRTLKDPENARHTLKWLFGRSVRGLDELTKRILSAAGLLASDAFAIEAIEFAFKEDTDAIRNSIKRLIHRGMLRLADEEGHREFAHVLAYQFARSESNVDDSVRSELAQWLYRRIQDSMVDGQNVPVDDLVRCLQHVSALLSADQNLILWTPLVNFILYDGSSRLQQVGRLEWLRTVLLSVSDWLHRKSEQDSESSWQREYSVSLNKLGGLAIAEGNLPEASRLFSDGLAVAQRLAESDPGNAGRQRDLSVSFNKLGDLAIAEGNLPEARRLFGEDLAVAQRLAESDPGNAGWQRDLSVSLDRLGGLAIAEGNFPEARKLIGNGLAIRQRLAESDPGNAGWQRDLSVSLKKLGDLAIAEGNLPEARRLFGDCLTVGQRLAESDPGNAGWQRDLSVSLNKLGDLAIAEGNLPEARRLFGDCLAVWQRLA